MSFGLKEDFNRIGLQERIDVLYQYLVLGKSSSEIAKEYYNNPNYSWKISAIAQGYNEKGGKNRGKYNCLKQLIEEFVYAYPKGTYDEGITLQDFIDNNLDDSSEVVSVPSIFDSESQKTENKLDVSMISGYNVRSIDLGHYYLITPYGIDYSVHEGKHYSIKSEIKSCEEATGRDFRNDPLASYIAFTIKEGSEHANFVGLSKIYFYDSSRFYKLMYFLFDEYLSKHKEIINEMTDTYSFYGLTELDIYKKILARCVEKLGYIVFMLESDLGAEEAYKISFKMLVNNMTLDAIEKFVWHLVSYDDICILDENISVDNVKDVRLKKYYKKLVMDCIEEYERYGTVDHTCETAILLANGWPEVSRPLIQKFRGLFAKEGYIDIRRIGCEIAESIIKDDLSIIEKIEEFLDYRIEYDVLRALRTNAMEDLKRKK